MRVGSKGRTLNAANVVSFKVEAVTLSNTLDNILFGGLTGKRGNILLTEEKVEIAKGDEGGVLFRRE